MQDFAKWSGLTVTDARSGLEAVQAQLDREMVDGQTYWFSTLTPSAKDVSPTVHLLSIYDEYVLGYKDRSAIVNTEVGNKLMALGNALSRILHGGRSDCRYLAAHARKRRSGDEYQSLYAADKNGTASRRRRGPSVW